jgi:hypothetical protein
MDTNSPADANIDSSLSLNPPTHLPSFDNATSSATALDAETASPAEGTATDPSVPAFVVLSTAQDMPSTPSAQAQTQSYTPAKLFQATGDVRNLARSPHSPSGFTVSIFDRHTRSWVHNINFSDIAIRGQLYILWKTAWQDPDSQSVREAIYDAAALTRADIQKDNNKWERNYSAARRRDWHPNFTVFYDDVFKRLWVHRIWPSVEIILPEPPRFLAEMARKMNKNAGAGAGMNIHQAEVAAAIEDEGETNMNPVALRTLKLRIIELETMNQVLREELERSQQEKAQLEQENHEFQARFEDIRQKLHVK